MTEPKVLELAPKPQVKRQLKPKIEAVQPTAIVDVWRLVQSSLLHGGQTYPDTTEDQPEVIQSHLFTYLQQPNFAGLIARVGKRPVGTVLGNVVTRPYGRPSRYAFVWCFWVEESYRKQGVGQLLWKEYTEKLKRASVFHWEAQAQEHLEKVLPKSFGATHSRLSVNIGGRL